LDLTPKNHQQTSKIIKKNIKNQQKSSKHHQKSAKKTLHLTFFSCFCCCFSEQGFNLSAAPPIPAFTGSMDPWAKALVNPPMEG